MKLKNSRPVFLAWRLLLVVAGMLALIASVSGALFLSDAAGQLVYFLRHRGDRNYVFESDAHAGEMFCMVCILFMVTLIFPAFASAAVRSWRRSRSPSLVVTAGLAIGALGLLCVPLDSGVFFGHLFRRVSGFGPTALCALMLVSLLLLIREVRLFPPERGEAR